MTEAEVTRAGTRRRSMAALLGGVVVTNTAMVGATTAATLVGAQHLGTALSGVPNAAGVAGTAAGTLVLSALMLRRGVRAALALGYALAVLGAVVAALGAVHGNVLTVMLGMAGLGIGNGGAQLSRYSAADLYPQDRAGFVVGLIVWGGTVGALVGPNLIDPAARAAQRLGLPPLTGPFGVSLAAATCAGLASLAFPRRTVRARRGDDGGSADRRRSAWRRPAVRAALAAMIAGQLAMVAVMTMTPVSMHMHHDGLGLMGAVLTGHLAGMFLLSPLTGHLADRVGGRITAVLGIAVLLVSVAFSVAPGGPVMLAAALFLLGYGWNLTFVGGSTLLAQAMTAAERLAVQGAVDAWVWGTSALASIVAGILLSVTSFAALAVVAGLVSVVPLPLLTHTRTADRVRDSMAG